MSWGFTERAEGVSIPDAPKSFLLQAQSTSPSCSIPSYICVFVVLGLGLGASHVLGKCYAPSSGKGSTFPVEPPCPCVVHAVFLVPTVPRTRECGLASYRLRDWFTTRQ